VRPVLCVGRRFRSPAKQTAAETPHNDSTRLQSKTTNSHFPRCNPFCRKNSGIERIFCAGTSPMLSLCAPYLSAVIRKVAARFNRRRSDH